MIVGIILALIVIFIVIAAVSGIKQGKAFKKKIKDMNAIDGVMVTHVEGLGIGTGEKCDIIRFEDRLLIESKMHKFEIQLSQLRAAEVKSEQELIEKSKSVVGRALIGTLLVPGLGTIVGGMSGIGNKKKKGKKSHYLILNYIDQKGELSAVTFEDVITLAIKNFCKELNKSISQSSQGVIQL